MRSFALLSGLAALALSAFTGASPVPCPSDDPTNVNTLTLGSDQASATTIGTSTINLGTTTVTNNLGTSTINLGTTTVTKNLGTSTINLGTTTITKNLGTQTITSVIGGATSTVTNVVTSSVAVPTSPVNTGSCSACSNSGSGAGLDVDLNIGVIGIVEIVNTNVGDRIQALQNVVSGNCTTEVIEPIMTDIHVVLQKAIVSLNDLVNVDVSVIIAASNGSGSLTIDAFVSVVTELCIAILLAITAVVKVAGSGVGAFQSLLAVLVVDIAAFITVILKLCASVYVGLAVAIYVKLVVYLNVLITLDVLNILNINVILSIFGY